MKRFLLGGCFFLRLFLLSADTVELMSAVTDLTGLEKDHFLIQGFAQIDRALYLPEEYQDLAYGAVDIPLRRNVVLPSPHSLITLLMKGGLEESDRILIVGEESSYCAAALAGAGMEVYLIDPTAQVSSSYSLKKDTNLNGWIGSAPFDFILVLNNPREEVPRQLMDQLAGGGVLVMPLQSAGGYLSWIRIISDAGDWNISLLDRIMTLPLF